MTSKQTARLSTESLVIEFFRQSEGQWESQRRYYTLKKEGETLEAISFLTIRFLAQGSPELVKLAHLHQLTDETALICGAQTTWHSEYTGSSRALPQRRQPLIGSTVFGVLGNILYRDRGFATLEPITATYNLINPKTLCLRTEYSGSVFEEEIKLIGQQYRTRQTLSSRAGEEQMIAQYLEKRIT